MSLALKAIGNAGEPASIKRILKFLPTFSSAAASLPNGIHADAVLALRKIARKDPAKVTEIIILSNVFKGYGLGLLSDSGIRKPSGNVRDSRQASRLLVFLLPMLQTPDTLSSLLISWERVCSSHCNTQPNGCFSQPCSLCTQQYLHFQRQVLRSHLLFRVLFSIHCRAHMHCSGNTAHWQVMGYSEVLSSSCR